MSRSGSRRWRRVRAAGPRPAAGPAAASSDGLARALAPELGAPIAILPSAEGLIAVSADGAHRRVLVPAPVTWAMVDDRAQVIWFGTGSSIRLLDTTVAAPAPEDVVRGLPDEVISGEPGLVIGYADAAGDDTLMVGHPAYYSITVKLDDAPDLVGDPGVWTDDEEFSPAVAAIPLTAPVQARLVELWKRGAGRAVALPAPAPVTERVAVDDPEAVCEDEDQCGTVDPIAGTSLWRVVVAFSCGDGCYRDFAIYDPATRAFVDGDPWDGVVQQAWVSPDGLALIKDGAIVRRDGAGVVMQGEGRGGGWLGGGHYIGF